MTQPVQQASQIVMGPPVFASIRDVLPSSTPTTFTVRATTDYPIQLQMDWWSQNDPSVITAGTAPVEAGPTTQHSFTVTLPAGNHAGYVFGFNFRQDSNDTSGFQWRPFQGTVQIVGSRASRNQTVPVRFYQFGGTPPPGAGGSAPPGPGSNGPNIGNWSTYTWAQYNPKLTTYPTP